MSKSADLFNLMDKLLPHSERIAVEERNERVSKIAFACGFTSLSHFCRTFKETFGVPAGQFRTISAVSRLDGE